MKTKFAAVMLFGILSLQVFATPYVVIGDSHSCGGFGAQLLKNKFGKAGNTNTVKLYCVVSGAPNHWLTGQAPKNMVCKTATSAKPAWQDCSTPGGTMPTAEQILAANPGATVVVALGTNSLLSPNVPASYKQLADLVKKNNRNCLWIAPPHLNPAQSKGFPAGRVQTLEENLDPFYIGLRANVSSECSLFDSRPATQPGTAGYQTVDGVHRTPEAGVFWANAVNGSIPWH